VHVPAALAPDEVALLLAKFSFPLFESLYPLILWRAVWRAG
jgi:hypothetical protein